ncbi:MAG: hypothetical protein AAF217_02260 [Pseudomonadota bacterium]
MAAISDRKISIVVGSLAVFAVLTGCSINDEPAGPPLLNGNWASSDGVYVAELRNGSFRAIANDTGGVISQGEYIALAEDRVQIKWNGLVSGNVGEANCSKPDPNRLDCVDTNGNRFSLQRTS